VPNTIPYVLRTERAELVVAAGNADGRGFQDYHRRWVEP
jgi:hypothetical protein